jgi:[acyl-carrier-protein] S-malonyltransferase
VAGAFHTSLMEQAAEEFRGVLDGLSVGDPAIPVMSNVTARQMTSSSECIADLGQQIRSPVRWHQSIVAMQDAGVSTFVEIGPGRALITMLKRDVPRATLASLDGSAVVASPTNV